MLIIHCWNKYILQVLKLLFHFFFKKVTEIMKGYQELQWHQSCYFNDRPITKCDDCLPWLHSTLWASAVTSLRPWLPARLPSSLRVTGMTPLGSVRPFYLALLDTCFCTQDSLPDLSWHLFCKAAPCSPHHCITTIVFFYIHLSWNSWNNESDIILFLHHVSVTMPLCCGCYITLYVTESDDTK